MIIKCRVALLSHLGYMAHTVGSGKETFTRLKAIDPKVMILLLSGYSLGGQAEKILAECCRRLMK